MIDGPEAPTRAETCERRRGGEADRRGQANLIAVAVALVLLTSVLGASVAIAESVLVDATEARDPVDRHAAATLAARLAADAPAGAPRGVVRDRETLSGERVDRLVPALEGAAVTVELDGRTLFQRGDASGGVAVRRGVVVGTPVSRTAAVNLTTAEVETLDDRTTAVTLGLHPGPNTTIHTVRVNGRVVLHNDSGLAGEATVPTSARRTTELRFETSVTPSGEANTTDTSGTRSAAEPRGRVDVSYTTVSGAPATLVVTVDG